jgi:hypothetical protein
MSSEDLESLIVSDESLLDPSVDTSRLRRTTDTRQELLGDLQPGLQYDPTLQSTYSDLLRYFSGDLNLAPATTVTTPAVGSPTSGGGDGTIGTGSGGQETESEGIAGFDPGVTPGPSGFIGLDPDMDIDPRDIDDYGTYEQTATSPTTQPIDPSGMLPQVSGMPSMLGDTGGSMDQMSGTMPSMLGDTGGSMDQMSGAQQESALSEAFRKGKDALDSGVQTISQVGQSIAESVQGTYNDLNRTVNVPGLGDIDVGKTLGGLAVNALVGAPVSFVKYAMDQIPPSASQLEYEGYTDAQKGVIDEAYGPGGSMEGYNQVSGFGKGVAGSVQDRIDNIEARKNAGKTYSQTNLDKLKDLQNNANLKKTTDDDDPGGSIEPSGLDTVTGPNIDEDPDPVGDDPGGDDSDPSGEDDRDAFGGVPGVPDAISGTIEQSLGGGDGGSPSTDDFADDFDDGTMTGNVDYDSITPGTLSGLATLGDGDGSGNTGGYTGGGGSGVPDAIGGGGNNDGGGKGIVCTMMNEFYGFGSFRNKIWLEHSKGLAPEYQKGYHKIFLPLVAYARKDGVTNKIVRKILEHIAIHRTIDIRQESRGKVHLLGRVYRKILEPICYWVGKYG